ncbi:polyadenylate binding protein [Vairimorpha apis BRL 01]|uniref:Polyadenylate binding protein n=1 Tax=Vairimorpha apis BRL 01 TaxID=1037528 RepID=T0MKK8_9MICR|nr:polyadenylate binding protein [Vairimorpha apis BRL 01]
MRKTNSLGISNLTKSVTVKAIADAFSKYEDKIIGIKITQVKGKFGKSRTVGIVEFDDVTIVEEIVGQENITIGEETFHVYFSKNQSSVEKVTVSDKKLYIRIPKDLRDLDLNEMLGDCKISTTKNDSGIVFAEFDTPDKQEQALEKLANYEVDGKKVRASKAFDKVFPVKTRNRSE